MKLTEVKVKDSKEVIRIIDKIKIPKEGLLIVSVGDKDHEPSKEEINRSSDCLRDALPKGSAQLIVTPYWIRFKLVKPNKVELQEKVE